MTQRFKAVIPWLALILLVLLPAYLISASLAIRSGLFDLQDRSITDREIQAIWTLVASVIASAATLVGLILAQSHNERTLERTALDTVVKGLELIDGDKGEYASGARVSGALAALVHLGHPVIAMRALAVAWKDDAVDVDTAAWLIGEVFETGSDDSKVEASDLLRDNASKLCGKQEDRPSLSWPHPLREGWPADLPWKARYNNVITVLEVLMSRHSQWWSRTQGWAIVLLDDARLKDNDYSIRDLATSSLKILLENSEGKGVWKTRSGWKDIATIRSEVDSHEIQEEWWDFEFGLLTRLAAWSEGGAFDPQEDPGRDNTDSPPSAGVGPAEGGRRPPAGRP